MTQTTCPRCDCTTLQYQENYGYWECLDCGHFWALDADDPDYDDTKIDNQTLRWCLGAAADDATLCGTCGGGGLIQEEGELVCCTRCGGSGDSASYG
ncbi:hypothetical protein [Nostoc sp. 'Peltigera malacea cyanobiont' DB3992]|uniref:hypothetical protein n=1 Tax=Nostoc sp. 'Peltigera malacea cyanobiont' DB3992 TaxID=1206980 RepID=UPI000C0524EB|nr:hypothetical protein [Nostoc sp. 'Peltigera malacea cyanobiont' DB3992]PHM11656.1 hypothetical protein CK516_01570 [Nostoc sp. 'Peltigera malacea cyanobiont' DB3992]